MKELKVVKDLHRFFPPGEGAAVKAKGKRGKRPMGVEERRAAFIVRYGSGAFDRLWNALTRSDKTLDEIGKDFGVSRQAVDLWTKSLALPYDGHRRLRARREAIIMARREAIVMHQWKRRRQRPILLVLAECASNAGVSLEPYVRGDYCSARHVLLNGRPCHVQGAYKVCKGEYAHFGTPNRRHCDCEFSAFVWLPGKRVFIVPKRAIGGERHLYFRLSEIRSKAGRKDSFHWGRFEDGWRLLGPAASSKKRGLKGYRRQRGNDLADKPRFQHGRRGRNSVGAGR